MKQNERLLVYAVTGFLALILVIAVVFGNDPENNARGGSAEENGKVQDLGKLLGDDPAPAGDAAGADPKAAPANGGTGLATPAEVSAERPLVAKVQVARDLVEQQLGPSRRDRMVRFVRARSGDSLGALVQRWCGSTSYLAEAKSLNEELTTLAIGEEVAVPWVDDEQLVEILEARQPRVLASDPAARGAVAADGNRTTLLGTPMPASARTPNSPDFLIPGTRSGGDDFGGGDVAGGDSAGRDGGGASGPAAAVGAATVEYTIQRDDALWTIAAKRFGKGRADKMVQKILQLNPGLRPEKLRVGQKILLPAS